jgi:hypothetical protein
MTREQRNKAIQRLELLELRLDGISAITDNGCPIDMGNLLQPIIDETKAELDLLEKTLATKWEFLFNFKSGGWNSEIAFTREEAIEQAIANYGQPSEDHKVLNIDVTSFRVSTTHDKAGLLSSFH